LRNTATHQHCALFELSKDRFTVKVAERLEKVKASFEVSSVHVKKKA
jgi:hypothetical protein